MRIVWILLAALPMAWAADDGRAPLPLSLKRAVELALSPEGSTNIQLSGEALKQAQRTATRSARGVAAGRGKLGGVSKPNREPGG